MFNVQSSTFKITEKKIATPPERRLAMTYGMVKGEKIFTLPQSLPSRAGRLILDSRRMFTPRMRDTPE